MVPGSSRQPRLGDDPTQAAASYAFWASKGWDLERIFGLNISGKLKPTGGSGITIGAQPSTILAGMLGSIVGASVTKSTTKGVIFGFLGGAVVATTLRWTESIGF